MKWELTILHRIVGPWIGLTNEILKFGSIGLWVGIEVAFDGIALAGT